jgi:uncharacterized protein (TIGR03067 family)
MTVWQTRSQLPIIRCFVVAAFVFGTAQATSAADADESANELNGGWRLVAVELNGEAREIDDDVRWTIKNEQVLYGGEPLATLACYPTSSPKGIDVNLIEPKTTYEGVYLLEKDELRICLNVRTLGPRARPSDFTTKDNPDLRVLIFQRQSPADAPESVKGFIGMVLSVENQAVVISDVLEKSPAEKAGLRAGDVLLTVGNDIARDIDTTVEAVRGKPPGSSVLVRVRRGGKEKELAVTVAVFPFSLLGLLG